MMKRFATSSFSTLLLCALWALCTAVQAQTTTWTGATNTDWNTASNWSAGVPTATHHAVIPSTTNKPIIGASTAAVAQSVHVQTGGELTIAAMGSLTINGFFDHGSGFTAGLRNEGTISNSGQLTLGSTASVGVYGIWNQVTFTNNSGGEIAIDRSTGSGLFNAASFSNSGKVTIGANHSVGFYGLESQATFTNNSGGEITIDRSSSVGLYNAGSSANFTNSGKITIGANHSVGANGLANQATFTNNSGGEIAIDRSSSSGLYNFGSSGNFSNSGKIGIGANHSVGFDGLSNGATFTNHSGGEIAIDRSSFSGLYNFGSSANFTNSGKIAIGANHNVGFYGLESRATFTNNSGGEIAIDRSSTRGLWNVGSSANFTNSGKITIGANHSVGANGLDNQAVFTNNSGGEIAIDRSSFRGLLNAGSSANFSNSGKIVIGANHSVGTYGTDNQASASFQNNACAEIYQYAPLFNNSTFTNSGLMLVSTTGAHSNTALTNHGILAYPQGNPIPNVTNNEIIVASTTSNDCQSVSPAFGLGSPVDFVIHGVFTDASATMSAGTYTAATNTFTPTAPLSNGASYDYFVKIEDGTGGCTRIVPWEVTVADGIAPTALCQNVTVSLDGTGNGSTTAAAVDNGSTDNCGIGSLSVSPGAFTCANVGPNTVTLTVTDVNSNTATCTATATVQDILPPTALCQDVTVSLDGTGNGSTTAAAVDNGSTDNCGIGSMSVSPGAFTCANIGPNTVTLTVTDVNSNTATCTATATVQDDLPPSITCPAPVTVICASLIPAVNLASVIATDNCSTPTKAFEGAVTSDSTCVNRKTVTRTYRATDDAGNSSTCTHVITVFDNVQPNFTSVPAHVTVQCNSVPAVGNASATDGCGGAVSVVYNGQTTTAGSCPDAYTLTRQWTATDVCGNTRTATQQITVIDTQKPNFTSVPANITVQCNAIPAPGTPTATDNCDTDVTVAYNGQTTTAGSCPNRYTLTRRWTATDNCGNTRSTSQVITVIDTQPPFFTTFPANTTISCNAPVPPVGTPTATDACGSATVQYLGQTTANSVCPGTYEIRRTWRATDQCGNSTASTQIIQVVDHTPPVFTSVPGPITINCTDPLPPLVNPTATDACSPYVHITFLGNTPSGSGCAADYTIIRTWRADDLCGNSATATQVITVKALPFSPGDIEERDATKPQPQAPVWDDDRILTLQPNPTTDRVLIGLGSFAGERVVVAIHNDMGQLIWGRAVDAVPDLLLPVSLRESGASAGLYTVSVRSSGRVVAKCLVLIE